MPSSGSVVQVLEGIGTRIRVLYARAAEPLGLDEASFLVPLAVLVGMVTAVAAVGFHELILFIRDRLTYGAVSKEFLYGPGLWLLIVIPAAGGLAVGVISRKLAGEKESHGVVDVIESVARTKGFVRPGTALEKIFTSAITIGTGGSAGAEGPIVQIGAALSGGVGALFRIARHQMPILIGCGAAAGISAIFNAPIGGLLFTLEVILLDFSIRTITPIIVASVVANVTMRAVVPMLGEFLHHGGESAYITVFADPQLEFSGDTLLNWQQMGNFVLLGLACGVLGVLLAAAMGRGERIFKRFTQSSNMKAMRPMFGGAILGLMGVAAVLLGRYGTDGQGEPFGFTDYPQPAFFGDGYGVIETVLDAEFYTRFAPGALVALLVGLCLVKVLATVATLSSGGSGGIIAPSLFLGATLGGAVGVLLRETGLFADIRPEAYALIGMAAVLAAVVHAPLASILILFEITHEEKVLLATMLAVVVGLGTARLINRDSLYTAALRRRGVQLSGADPVLLSRLTVEQVDLEPAAVVRAEEPMQRIVELLDHLKTRDLIVLDEDGRYAGFLANDDINAALLGREAVPLMIVGELMRPDVPLVLNTDDLARVFDLFARYDVAHLPVGLAGQSRTVIGMISRAGIMRRYRRASEG